MTFKDLKGLEGIDKMVECAPYIDEIFGDKDIFNDDIGTFGEIAIPAYKKHTDSFNHIFDILEIDHEDSLGIIQNVVMILRDLTGNAEVASFFTGISPNLKSWIEHMVSIAAEQSAALSDTSAQK